MHTFARKGYIVSCLALLFLLCCLPACGTNFPATTSSATPTPSKFSAIPVGKGMDPEPGTDGKPAPLPNGHSESIIVSSAVAYVGSDNGLLYALDTTGGAVRWSYHVGAAVWLYSVSDGVVYAAGDTVLYALNAGSGKLLWRYRGSKWISQAIVVAGTVYTATSAENNASIIVALRATDGGKLWTYSVSAATLALMGVVDSVVYVAASSDGPGGLSVRTISALRADDGRLLWNMTPRSDAGLANGGIVAANGLVYFATSQGDIYALRTDTGRVAWHAGQSSTPGLPPNAPTPTLASGLLYMASPLGLFAYNASDGRLVWQGKTPFPGGPIVVQPVVVSGVVYSGGQRETILALRASDGKLLWQYSTGGIASTLAVIDGMVINYSGPVEALRASDGKLLWQQNVSISGIGSDAAGPETVGDGVVVVGGDNGMVQAIRVSDGKLLWHYAIQELPVQSPPSTARLSSLPRSCPTSKRWQS